MRCFKGKQFKKDIIMVPALYYCRLSLIIAMFLKRLNIPKEQMFHFLLQTRLLLYFVRLKVAEQWLLQAYEVHCILKHLNNPIEQDYWHVKRRFAQSLDSTKHPSCFLYNQRD